MCVHPIMALLLPMSRGFSVRALLQLRAPAAALRAASSAALCRAAGGGAARALHASAAAAQTGAKKKPAAGGGGGGGGGSAAPVAEEKFDLTKVVPVNLKKDGSFLRISSLPSALFPPPAPFLPFNRIILTAPAGTDPPLSAPDSGAYPPWLFELLDDKPILADHLQKGLENVAAADLKSVIRQINRKRIKDGNDVRRKK